MHDSYINNCILIFVFAKTIANDDNTRKRTKSLVLHYENDVIEVDDEIMPIIKRSDISPVVKR